MHNLHGFGILQFWTLVPASTIYHTVKFLWGLHTIEGNTFTLNLIWANQPYLLDATTAFCSTKWQSAVSLVPGLWVLWCAEEGFHCCECFPTHRQSFSMTKSSPLFICNCHTRHICPICCEQHLSKSSTETPSVWKQRHVTLRLAVMSLSLWFGTMGADLWLLRSTSSSMLHVTQ